MTSASKVTPDDVMRASQYNNLLADIASEVSSHRHRGGGDGAQLSAASFQPQSFTYSQVSPSYYGTFVPAMACMAGGTARSPEIWLTRGFKTKAPTGSYTYASMVPPRHTISTSFTVMPVISPLIASGYPTFSLDVGARVFGLSSYAEYSAGLQSVQVGYTFAYYLIPYWLIYASGSFSEPSVIVLWFRNNTPNGPELFCHGFQVYFDRIL